MKESTDSEGASIKASPKGPFQRWSQLSAGGKRRIGEFLANIALGVAAASMTLIVIPGVTGAIAIALWNVIGGVIIAAAAVILAVLIRVLTEELKGDGATEAEA